MNIRKYQEKDKQNLRTICIATAPPQRSDTARRILCLLYNDYYTETEPDNCFVLADDADEAVGYIICAEDFCTYKNNFTKKYLPQIGKLSRMQSIIRRMGFLAEQRYAKEYPAHLHIDILHDYTGNGNGSNLINTLLSHLRDKGIKGVMLGVSNKNLRAIKFYKKHGFTVLKRLPGSTFMGKKLSF